MAPKDLIMLDEEDIEVKREESIAVVISKNCEIRENVIMIPMDEALSIASNIIIQVDMLR